MAGGAAAWALLRVAVSERKVCACVSVSTTPKLKCRWSMLHKIMWTWSQVFPSSALRTWCGAGWINTTQLQPAPQRRRLQAMPSAAWQLQAQRHAHCCCHMSAMVTPQTACHAQQLAA
jgi:hypothetical protein